MTPVQNNMMNQSQGELSLSPLGKKSAYINTYTPSLLFPIPRKSKRDEIGITHLLPFSGFDIWTGYELSWLNLRGKPLVAMADFWVPCESPNIWESKSMKLYLNSLNGSQFESMEQVKEILVRDLSEATESPVQVDLFSLDQASEVIGSLRGECIDDLDVSCSEYMPNPNLLRVEAEVTDEVIHTNLLKSNCLVTGQPDWGSVEISYKGPKLDHGSLIQYIVSLRDHNEFHEQCVERIFCDIQRQCKPQWLGVYARYTRRGGLDINPYRVTVGSKIVRPKNFRLVRQ